MPAPVTYPDGSVLASTALTITPDGGTLGPIIQQLTLGMLGLPQTADSSKVRLEWAQQGQPFQQQKEDICYIRCTLKDDPYDKIRERTQTPNDAETNNEQWNYTRVWEFTWVFYGPNATDSARVLRSALYQDYFTNAFAQSQLFPVSEIPEARRVPEKIGGLWFERVDLPCDFYEFVTENIERQTVKSVEVQVLEADEPVIQTGLIVLGEDPFTGPNASPLPAGNWTPAGFSALTDPFSGPDQSPIGAPWINSIGSVKLANHTVQPVSPAVGTNAILYSSPEWTPDQFSQAQIAQLKQNAGYLALVLRSDTQGKNFYYIDFDASPGFGGVGLSTPINIQKQVNGVSGLVKQLGYFIIQIGDTLHAEIIGNTISVFLNGTRIGQYTDPTPILNGIGGLLLQSSGTPSTSDVAWTNWTGGAIDTAPLQLLNGVCVASDVLVACGEFFTAVQLPNDQFVQATVKKSTVNAEFDLLLRSDPAANVFFYDVGFTDNGDGTVFAYIFKAFNGFGQDLWENPRLPFSFGDTFRGEANGNVISFYQNDVLLHSLVDNEIPSGLGGLFLFVDKPQLDVNDLQISDFKAGTRGTRSSTQPSTEVVADVTVTGG